MSKAGSILFLFAFLFMGGVMVARTVIGGWIDPMWVPFGLAILCFLGALAKDWRSLGEFFTLKTTKHGMNMGAAILLALVTIVCLNVLAVRYNKSFDWTQEKIHSLSDQSSKAVRSLKADTEIVLLYNPEDQPATSVSQNLGFLVRMYENENKRVRYSPYDARRRPDLTKKYEMAGNFAIYAVQGERKVRIEQPTEEGLTRGLMQLEHTQRKPIYFLTGHGERDLESQDQDGMAVFKQDLMATYEPKTLNLVATQGKIPDDAGLLVIMGPRQQLLESELQAIREFARKGGALLIAADPGEKHNLALLTKTFGVEFNNDYVVDYRMAKQLGATTVSVFDKSNEITRSLAAGSFAVFYKASSLAKAPQAPAGLEITELAKTDGGTLKQRELAELQGELTLDGPHIVGMQVKGILPAADAKQAPGKPFTAIIFGDSDAFNNGLIGFNLNRDLAMNTVASLMQDTNLISIRPKELKATKLEMLDSHQAIYVIAVLFMIPLATFAMGFGFWFRRRLA